VRLRASVGALLGCVREMFDIILIDCPPGLSVLTEHPRREETAAFSRVATELPTDHIRSRVDDPTRAREPTHVRRQLLPECSCGDYFVAARAVLAGIAVSLRSTLLTEIVLPPGTLASVSNWSTISRLVWPTYRRTVGVEGTGSVM